jgi:hypothetical protein
MKSAFDKNGEGGRKDGVFFKKKNSGTYLRFIVFNHGLSI